MQSSTNIKDRIKNKVASSCSGGIKNSQIVESMIDALSQKEIDRRAEALIICFNEWERLNRDLIKASKPDNVVYTEDGKAVRTFSADAMKKLEELKNNIERIDKAITKAIEEIDYSEVFDIAAKAEN